MRLLEKNVSKMILIASLSIFLFGCNAMNQFSPEKVISNALAAENEISYYGEMEMSMDGVEELSGMVIKEWRLNEKSRLEMSEEGGLTVAVNDGESIITYNENEKTAVKITSEDLQELYMYPREQVEFILDLIRDTHDIETVGEEKIANRDAFHLIAKKKEDEKSLFGDQELWIDKEHWVVLKMKIISGGTENNIEYTKIDFNTKLDDSIFQLDLPEDVEIQNFDDLDAGFSEEEIALNDIPEKMGQNVLYIPDSDEHKLGSITYMELEGEPSYTDVTIDYKQSGLPLMTLTILATEEGNLDEELELFGEGAEKVKVRNNQGIFIDLNEFQSLSWDESGLRYSIDIIDPKLTIDDVITFAEEMEEVK